AGNPLPQAPRSGRRFSAGNSPSAWRILPSVPSSNHRAHGKYPHAESSHSSSITLQCAMREAPAARLLAHWAACIMTTASMESHCISFREIPQATELFISFLEDFRRVSAYYAHPPTMAGVEEAAKQVKLDAAVRRVVVEVLREQNARFAGSSGSPN